MLIYDLKNFFTSSFNSNNYDFVIMMMFGLVCSLSKIHYHVYEKSDIHTIGSNNN